MRAWLKTHGGSCVEVKVGEDDDPMPKDVDVILYHEAWDVRVFARAETRYGDRRALYVECVRVILGANDIAALHDMTTIPK